MCMLVLYELASNEEHLLSVEIDEIHRAELETAIFKSSKSKLVSLSRSNVSRLLPCSVSHISHSEFTITIDSFYKGRDALAVIVNAANSHATALRINIHAHARRLRATYIRCLVYHVCVLIVK